MSQTCFAAHISSHLLLGRNAAESKIGAEIKPNSTALKHNTIRFIINLDSICTFTVNTQKHLHTPLCVVLTNKKLVSAYILRKLKTNQK